MTTQEAFADSVDQDQTGQNVQFGLPFTQSTFFILDCKLTVFSSCNGSLFLANEKAWFIYSVVKDLNCLTWNLLCLSYKGHSHWKYKISW